MMANDPTNAINSSMNERALIQAGMTTVDVASLPIRGIDYVVENGIRVTCSSHPSMRKICGKAAEYLDLAVTSIPESWRSWYSEKSTTVKSGTSSYLERNYGITRDRTTFTSESAGLLIGTAATLGIGKIAVTAAKTLKGIAKTVAQSSQGIKLPYIDGIAFKHMSLKEVPVIQLKSKTGKGILEASVLKGEKASSLVYVEWLQNTTGSSGMTFETVKALKEIAQANGSKRLFVQFQPVNSRLHNLLASRLTYKGHHPFYYPESFAKEKLRLKHPWKFDSKTPFPVYEISLKGTGKSFAHTKVTAIGAGLTIGGLTLNQAEANDRGQFPPQPNHETALSLLQHRANAPYFTDSPIGEDGQEVPILVTNEDDAGSSSEGMTKGDYEQLKNYIDSAVTPTLQMNEQLLKRWKDEDADQKRIEFDREYAQIKKNVTNAGTIASLFTNQRVAHQIGAISEAMLTTGLEVSALMGYGTLALSTGPLSACLAIGAAATKVIEAFSSSGPSTVEVMVELARALSEQIAEVQRQMHERFDQLDDKVDDILNTSIQGLNNLQHSSRYHSWKLDRIEKKVDEVDGKIGIRFTEIKNTLNRLAESLRHHSRSKQLEELSSLIYHYLNETPLDQTKYRERVDQLFGYATHRATKPLYTGEPLSFSTSPTDQDFGLTTLLDELKVSPSVPLPNPTVYVMSTLGVLFLTLKQYPSLNSPPLFRIAHADLDRVKKVQTIGEQLRNALIELPNDVSCLSLRARVYAVREKVFPLVTQSYNELIEETNLNYNKGSLNDHLSVYGSINDQERFKREISIEVQPKGCNWFTNNHFHERHQKGYAVNPSGEGRWIGQYGKVPYVKKSEECIRSQKKAYLQKRLDEAAKAYDNDHPMTSSPENSVIRTIEMPWFIFPKDNSLPSLPVPEDIRNHIPHLFLVAASRNLGHFQFNYSLKEDSKFLIDLNFVSKNHPNSLSIGSLEIDYDPGFYHDAEAVWWFWSGGNYPKDKIAPLTNYHYFTYSAYPNQVWVYANIPTRVQQAGAVDRFGTIEKKISLNTDSDGRYPELDNLLRKDQEEKHRFYQQRLTAEVQGTGNNELIKRKFEQLDQASKRLLAYICTSFRDQVNNPSHELHRWVNGDSMAILSSQKLTDQINNASIESSIFDESQVSSKFCLSSYELSKIVKKELKNVERKSFEALDLVLEISDFVLQYYKDSAVEFNHYYESNATRDFQDDLTKELGGLVGELLSYSAKGDAIPPEVMIKKAKLMQERLSKKVGKMNVNEQANTDDLLKSLFGNSLGKLT
ncbi:MAG: hypothetical protein AAGG81_06115 [Chlamydiota bacterium]